jgi:hypothetical protein
MFAGFLKTLGLFVKDEGRICLRSKPLQDPNTKRKDHENPNRPSPADRFNNITADDGSKDRPNEGTDQENCDTDNLFKTRVPNLQVRMGIYQGEYTSVMVPAPRVAGGEQATPERNRRARNPPIF